MHNGAFSDQMERWGQLTGGVAEHASGAAFLRPAQETLIQARAEAWEAKRRQLYHRAAAQQATRDLEAAMAKAQEAATRLQHGLLAGYGATNPKLIVFGMHPRRAVRPRTRDQALEALRGAPPPHAVEPASHVSDAPSARGAAPPAEAEASWAGGDVPQAESDAAALSRTPREEGGEAPQAEGDVAARGETAPPAVGAPPAEVSGSQPAMRIIPIWLSVSPNPSGMPPEPVGMPQPGFVTLSPAGEAVGVASAA
jgi:hypothetical protein